MWRKVNPKKFFKTFAKYLTRLAQCAIVSVQVKGSPKSGSQEKIKKILKNLLTNLKFYDTI